MKPKTISIIGGTGKMGQRFKGIFEGEGYDVIITGRNTEITNEDAAKKGDVVIITVPIRETLEVIRSVGPHIRKGALLTDFTSVKIEPVKAMLENSEAEVIGGHPVFGPTVDLKKQDYVLCPSRGNSYVEWLKTFLEKQGANVIITTPEDHDKRMGIIQCLTHLSAIAAADSLKNMKIDVEKTLELASPIYRMRMEMVGRILNQDPELYSDIQIFNPFSREIAAQYKKSLERLSAAIEMRDLESFDSLFREASEYLGNFCKVAQENSDFLIRKMAERANGGGK